MRLLRKRIRKLLPKPWSLNLSFIISLLSTQDVDEGIFTDDEELRSAMTEWNDGIEHDEEVLGDRVMECMRRDLRWQQVIAGGEGEGGKGAKDRWSEAVDSKSIIPRSYMPNNLRLVASLIAGYMGEVDKGTELIVMGGRDDKAVLVSSLEGWKSVKGNADVQIFDGGHFFHTSETVGYIANSVIGSLKVLSKAAHETVTGWNGNSREYPNDSTLHGEFAKAVKIYPSQTAVIDGDGGKSFTYREIDDMSTLLAAKLYHEHGVRPGGITGIFMGRNWQFVVAYLAALKAGGGERGEEGMAAGVK